MTACGKRVSNDYSLNVVFHCASPQPTINVLRNPAMLDWQAVVKIEHYRLKVDSAQHPVELREERADYDARHGA